MAFLIGCLCLVLTFLQSGNCLEIQSLTLVGGRSEYIDVASGLKYKLSCIYRSGYDELVYEVVWLLYGNVVYRWTADRKNDPNASGVLLGRVDTSPDDEPASLHFTKLDYLLAGNYTCRVSSDSKTVHKTYYLHVVDVSPVPYESSVHILKDLQEKNEVNKPSVTYDIDSAPGAASDEVEFEDTQCTLVWSFKTPAIFPKPNVTCGYYSFIHDEVIHHLPAGLTMHKFINESWQASFDATRVQVSSVPVDHRLACSVKIPDTAYREIIKGKDDFAVDTVLDSNGCPGLDDLSVTKGIKVESRDSTTNCRGHLLPNDREAPAIVKLSCPGGHAAIFQDGAIEPDWWTELSCFEYDQLWRSYQEDGQHGELIDVNELPVCDRGVGAGCEIKGSVVLTSLALLTLLALRQNH